MRTVIFQTTEFQVRKSEKEQYLVTGLYDYGRYGKDCVFFRSMILDECINYAATTTERNRITKLSQEQGAKNWQVKEMLFNKHNSELRNRQITWQDWRNVMYGKIRAALDPYYYSGVTTKRMNDDAAAELQRPYNTLITAWDIVIKDVRRNAVSKYNSPGGQTAVAAYTRALDVAEGIMQEHPIFAH